MKRSVPLASHIRPAGNAAYRNVPWLQQRSLNISGIREQNVAADDGFSYQICHGTERRSVLAIGEPPIARGYTPPSIYAEFPKASGKKREFSKGSITGICTVLVEGDDTNEPVADTVRGILDGHIVLSRQLANANHFPAIDISASISRLMNDIAGEEHRKAASRFRNMLSLYQKNADPDLHWRLQKGANSALDEAVDRIGDIE